MNKNRSKFPKDGTESERRKGLGDEAVKELELAGGVEGGMQAGSAGGPGTSDTGQGQDRIRGSRDRSKERSSR